MVTKKTFNSVDLYACPTSDSSIRNRVTVLIIVLSFSLLFLTFYFGASTNSLLLLEVGIIQAALTIFFCYRACSRLISDNLDHLRYRLFGALLSGFSLALSAGYMVCEIYDRHGQYVRIHSLEALLVAGAVFLGNVLIIAMMIRSQLTSVRIGSFKLSFKAIVKLSLIVLLATGIIHLTNYYFLDTILSLLLAVSLFIWAAFVVIDAYWRLGEVA